MATAPGNQDRQTKGLRLGMRTEHSSVRPCGRPNLCQINVKTGTEKKDGDIKY